jgi:uncharacterized phiE125 gp8 family phage protein
MIRVVEAPAEDVVNLLELKNHLRVDLDDDDSLIMALGRAATEWAEGYCNRSFVTTTYEYQLDSWPSGGVMPLPRPTLQEVVAVRYVDRDGVEAVLDEALYFVDVVKKPGRLVLNYGAEWPSVTLRPVAGVRVEFVAGYGGASAVPDMVKAAVKLLVGDLYENRENTLVAQGVTVAPMPFAARALLDMVRIKEFV